MNSAGTCTEGDVQAKGYNLHYLEWGEDGEDIIFLHGLAPFHWAHTFDPFCASLSGDYHIVAFDLLGHGDSDDPKKPIGYGEHADIIREGARELGLTKYVLWGYSFGGGTRTVDVHVARLRDKIKDSGVHIETVWNVGYKLVEG